MPARPPLRDSYGAKVALVLLALCPNIVVTTAVTLMTPLLQRDLGTTQTGIQLAEGLSNAAYAFGAVLAAGLRQKLPPRRLLLAYEIVFVIGSVLTGVAYGVAGFTVGRVLQGLATGLLLVAALPPLVTNFPVRKLPVTVAVVNIGLFGAVTIGPIVGGLVGAVASPLAWRLFFGGLAVLGLIALLLGHRSVAHQDPLDPDHRVDAWGLLLAAAGTALPFFAVSELTAAPIISVEVLPALLVGLACLVALVLVEFYRSEPLMPVRLLTHTFPVTGILGAMLAGASYVALLELAQVFLITVQHGKPLATGLLFWPNVVGLILAAVIFGALFRTRFVPVLATAGMVVLAAGGGALVTLTVGSGHLTILLAAAGLGFGAGATVSPGLFLAALAVPSSKLGEAFALVELLRSEAAFLVGPVLLYVAMSAGTGGAALTHGITIGAWVAIGLVIAGTLANIALFYAGGARLHTPDLEAWVGRGENALESPAVAAAVRDR